MLFIKFSASRIVVSKQGNEKVDSRVARKQKGSKIMTSQSIM